MLQPADKSDQSYVPPTGNDYECIVLRAEYTHAYLCFVCMYAAQCTQLSVAVLTAACNRQSHHITTLASFSVMLWDKLWKTLK